MSAELGELGPVTRQAMTAGTLGRGGVYRDPVWALLVQLRPVERHLLRSPAVRRLQFIAHAGAPSITTSQRYSRLDHSLGLLALTAHFAPGDQAARVAALLHDVGHLPFSHSLEGIAGLDHHRLGAACIRDMAPLLASYGVEADEVIGVVTGERPSALRACARGLKLDHFESFVRAGLSHGWLSEPPSQTLAKVRVDECGVSTDPVTARYLAELAVAGARLMLEPEGVIATGVLRHLVGDLLSERGPGRAMTAAGISSLTDDEMWCALLRHPRSARLSRLLRDDPLGWQVAADGDKGIAYQVDRLYLGTACVNGEPAGIPGDLADHLPSLPWRCVLMPAGS
jgi:uncharacterized protein